MALIKASLDIYVFPICIQNILRGTKVQFQNSHHMCSTVQKVQAVEMFEVIYMGLRRKTPTLEHMQINNTKTKHFFSAPKKLLISRMAR